MSFLISLKRLMNISFFSKIQDYFCKLLHSTFSEFQPSVRRTDNSAKDISANLNSDNSAKSMQTIQPVLQNARFGRKKSELETFLGSRSTVGALRARRCFEAITGSKFCIESYPLLASSQHVGATAAATITGWIVCILLAGLSEFQIGWIVFGRIVLTRAFL